MLVAAVAGVLRLAPAGLPCADACADAPPGSCGRICAELAGGSPFAAVGERFLNGALGARWELNGSALVRIGAPHCAEPGGRGPRVCEGCSDTLPDGGVWNFSEVAGNIVMVNLYHCDVLQQAARLGRHGARAVITVARGSGGQLLGAFLRPSCFDVVFHIWRSNLSGWYSKVAVHYIGAVATVDDDGAPVVMIDSDVGDVLWRVQTITPRTVVHPNGLHTS